MDEDLRELERLARAGDERALLKLEEEAERRLGPRSRHFETVTVPNSVWGEMVISLEFQKNQETLIVDWTYANRRRTWFKRRIKPKKIAGRLFIIEQSGLSRTTDVERFQTFVNEELAPSQYYQEARRRAVLEETAIRAKTYRKMVTTIDHYRQRLIEGLLAEQALGHSALDAPRGHEEKKESKYSKPQPEDSLDNLLAILREGEQALLGDALERYNAESDET